MQIKQRLCKERLGSGSLSRHQSGRILDFRGPTTTSKGCIRVIQTLYPELSSGVNPLLKPLPRPSLTLGLFFKNKVVRTVFPRQQIVTALAAVCVQILLSQTPLSSGKTT